MHEKITPFFRAPLMSMRNLCGRDSCAHENWSEEKGLQRKRERGSLVVEREHKSKKMVDEKRGVFCLLMHERKKLS